MNPEEELASGGRPARLLRTAGLEADRGDRRRARVNLVIAFVILFALGLRRRGDRDVGTRQVGHPRGHASPARRPGGRVNGVSGGGGDRRSAARSRASIAPVTATQTAAARPRRPIVVVRDGERRSRSRPAVLRRRRGAATCLGFSFVGDAGRRVRPAGRPATCRRPDVAGDLAHRRDVARIFEAEERKQISGVVGSYEVTRQSFASTPARRCRCSR